MSAILWYSEHSLALLLFGIGMKTDLFQSCGHWWVFQICWHIECSTSTALSFRIWTSSAEIPSPPLALFIVMLPKTCLTSHSRMSGARWVITPQWLSGSLRSFLCFPGGSDGKESACNVVPGLGRSLEEGNGNPLQYPCLENSMDGEAWKATVHGVRKRHDWTTSLSFFMLML